MRKHEASDAHPGVSTIASGDHLRQTAIHRYSDCVEGIDLLVQLGLTSYEAKAYDALLQRGSSTASQVADLSGLPRQRVYDVLAGLMAKGLASARPGQAARYTAIPPNLVIDRLLADRRRALTALERDAGPVVGQMTAAYEAGSQYTDPLDYVEVVREAHLTARRWDELQRQARREILVFAKPPYVTPAQANTVGLQVTPSHTTRCVYELAAFGDPDFLDGIHRFAEAGEDQRFVAELPLKLAIVDERMVMFAMTDPAAGGARLTSLVVEHQALARVLKIAFEGVWSTAMTYEEASASAAISL
jgi:HTH-type transcriptional regulator, sugar sensing transcriptional regulator